MVFTVEIRYHPEDNGYSAECFEMEAFAWGESYEEAVENLLDVMIGFAEVTIELEQQYPNLKDKSIAHAKFVLSLGGEEKLHKVLGL